MIFDGVIKAITITENDLDDGSTDNKESLKAPTLSLNEFVGNSKTLYLFLTIYTSE
ncbi:MAG: hypothetical protein ACI840_002671 [Ulvibacter sp.]|jgi:hypothetical protein